MGVSRTLMPWAMRLALAAGLCGSACTYITRAEYEEQLLQRDEDGDGVTIADGDCNDRDPDMFPGRGESPYDGKDNDCAGDGDLIDFDGDGFAAVQAGGTDCRDNQPDVRPTATDAPYDGRDADCAGDNDYDADGDGWMSPDIDPKEVAQYKLEWNAEFEERYGDCDDLDEFTFPGALGDQPYDGVDTNCDGANDFDADGDGFPGGEGGTDCLDLLNPEIAADPGDVFPGAKDIPYDGIDSDCGADDDFDVDQDGFFRAGDTIAHRNYELRYGYSFDTLDGDCDDDNEDIRPNALERLGDDVDQDCDRRTNGGPFGLSTLVFDTPRSPRGVYNDTHFALALVADAVDDGVNVLDNTVTMLVWDGFPLQAQDPVERQTVLGPDAAEALDAGVAITGSADSLTVASVDARSAGRTFSFFQPYAFDGTAYTADKATPLFHAGGALTIQGADIATASGNTWLWSCSDQDLQVTRLSDLATVTFGSPFDVQSCFASVRGDQGTLCGPSSCTTYELNPAGTALTQTSAQPYASFGWTYARRRGPLVIGADIPVGAQIVKDATVLTVFTGNPIRTAEAVEEGGEWFAVAIREDGVNPNEVLLAWGPEGGPLTTAQLLGLPTGLEPIDATLAASFNRLVVWVTLEDPAAPGNETLAWTIYERL